LGRFEEESEMSFNINEFSAKLNQTGVAKSNLFLVEITPPSGFGEESRHMTFMCKSVSIPGINIESAATSNNPIGPPEVVFYKTGKDPLSAQFIVDSDFRVLKFFHRWMQRIVNYNIGQGSFAEDPSGKLPYQFGYRSEYAGTVSVTVFSEHQTDRYYRYTFTKAFPRTLSGTEHSWDNSAEVFTLPVSFAYSHMSVDGVESGTVTSQSGQGIGLESYSPSFQNIVQTIQQIDRAQALQNVVDTITKIAMAYDKPRVTASLPDVSYIAGTGDEIVDASSIFENAQGGVWSVNNPLVSISQDGIITIPTDDTVSTTTITVTYKNEYGQDTAGFDLTIGPPAPVANGTIEDKVFPRLYGIVEIDLIPYFYNSSTGVWDVTGTGATIDQSGVLYIDTSNSISGETIVVTLTNDTGSDTQEFILDVNSAVPELINTITDVEINYFEQPRVYDVSTNFLAEGGVWSVSGIGATIDQYGVVTIQNTPERNTSPVVVRYTNENGAAEGGFSVSAKKEISTDTAYQDFITQDGNSLITASNNQFMVLDESYFSPESLFENSEEGVWYEIEGNTFKNSEGIVELSSVGDSGNLVIDLSSGIRYSDSEFTGTPELVTNFDFSSGSSGWTHTGNWSFVGGRAICDNSAGGSIVYLFQTALATDKLHVVRIDVESATGLSRVLIGNGNSGIPLSVGVNEFFGIQAGNSNIIIDVALGASVTINEISVKEVIGNPAIGGVSPPIYSSINNVAYLNGTNTETLNWDAPQGTYTIAKVGVISNPVIDKNQSLDGETNIHTIGDLVAYIAINRELTETEEEKLRLYLQMISQ
jgi:hypothetical protein